MSESLFTSQTPAAQGSDGAPGITTATTLKFAADGTVSAIRFYATATPSGTYTVAIWEVTGSDAGAGGTGTLLQSATISSASITGNAFNSVAITPVNVVSTKLYRVGVHNPSLYVATNNFFTSALTNGNITGVQDNTDPLSNGWTIRQGTFIIDAAIQYPRQVGSSASYFADVVFDAAGSGADGSAALTLPALTLAATTNVSATGGSALILPALTAAGTATVGASGAAAFTLPALALAATTNVSATGSSALTLPASTLAGAGTAGVAGAAALTLPAVTLAGVAETSPVAEGALTLPSLSLAATTQITQNNTGGSWASLGLALQEARVAHMQAERRRRDPVECPIHGWPLEDSPYGKHCKFGGHIVRTY